MNFYTDLINDLKDNEYFVFGSNPEGRHGAGTAKIAQNKFGAIYGQGRGIQGNSYAIPTKNLKKGFVEQISARKKITYEYSGDKSISKEQIKNNIKEFYKVARKMKDSNFYIAYQNDSRNLNGYTSKEMFILFTESFRIPKNIFFSDTFKDLAVELNIIKLNKYNVDKDGLDHLNVYSKAKTKLGRLLTNMSDVETPIIINDETYIFKSLEGYWYFLKIKLLTGKEDFSFVNKSCFDCKKDGKEILKEVDETKLDSFEFEKLIKVAIRNKIYNNIEIKNLLIKNKLKLTHYYYYGTSQEDYYITELIQYQWILDEIESIANELKNENELNRNFHINIVKKQEVPNHIYCGRGSNLGNPYTFTAAGKNHKAQFEVESRDEACEMYNKYFDKKVNIEKDKIFLNDLRNIFKEARKNDINLGCYCSPLRCHCETIKEFIEEKLKVQIDKELKNSLFNINNISKLKEIIQIIINKGELNKEFIIDFLIKNNHPLSNIFFSDI